MRYRTLPSTDIEVSVICQGCWSIIGGRTWGEQDRDDSVAAIRAAFKAGINFFDTAPAYGDGESEALIARALDGAQRDAVIATKISRGDAAPPDVFASCDRSLRALQVDTIDLLQLHWPNPRVPTAETIDAMRELVSAGKVRAIGVSNFGTSYLADLPTDAGIVTNQIAYSLLFRPPERAVIPACKERGIGILCYSPICQGLLAGKFGSPGEVPEGRARTRLFRGDRPQATHGERGCEAETFEAVREIGRIASDINEPMAHVALAWLLEQKNVTAAIAGARNADQARDNAAAGDLTLKGDVLEALTRAAEPVKDCLGENCDMWQVPSRMEKG
jgi:aryl-alcohol dehydrogenase-like predicted oxidoreductase